MPNAAIKTHPVTARKPPASVRETGDARREALDWIADQLHWESTLDALRARNARW